MALKLNEAPESVLGALNWHAFKRGCCTVTAILCCLPTLSVSVSHNTDGIGCGHGNCGCNGSGGCCSPQGSGCCYMGCLNEAEEGSLTGLQEGLGYIINAGNQRVKAGENLRTVALEQFQQTIDLLKEIRMGGSYETLLNDIKTGLSSRLKIYTETMRILGNEASQRRVVSEQPRQQVTIFSTRRDEVAASASSQSEEKTSLLVNEEERSHSHGTVPVASAPPLPVEAPPAYQQFTK